MSDNIKWPEGMEGTVDLVHKQAVNPVLDKALEKPPRLNKRSRCKVDVVGQGFSASYFVPETRLADLVSFLQCHGQRRRTRN